MRVKKRAAKLATASLDIRIPLGYCQRVKVGVYFRHQGRDGTARSRLPVLERRTCLEVLTDEVMNRADGFLKAAEANAAQGPDAYRDRVAFMRSGLVFAKLQLEAVRAMARVRESQGKDAAAVGNAIELSAARDAFLRRKENEFAINRRWAVEIWIGSRKMQDYLGPPSDAFRAAADLE